MGISLIHFLNLLAVALVVFESISVFWCDKKLQAQVILFLPQIWKQIISINGPSPF